MNENLPYWKELDHEKKLLLLLSRITFRQEHVELIKYLVLNESIEWPLLFQMAIQNKVLGLAYYNLKELNLDYKMPSRYRDNANFFYLGNFIRNQEIIKEYHQVMGRFRNEKIDIVPLKGAYLIPNMYQSYGVRQTSDLDLLIRREDAGKLTKAMHELGYVQGSLRKDMMEIVEYTKEKQLLWKMKMNNLLPFIKKMDSQYVECVKFDISFNLDLQLEKNPVSFMLERANKQEEEMNLRPSDFFVHLCCHLYKEASNAEWIFQNKDVNIIKFCDVREYILRKMSSIDLDEALQLAKDYMLEKSIYYTIFYLKIIYDDGYEDDLLSRLHIEDLEFLDQFGEKNFKQAVKFKQNFWQRLFSDTNSGELNDMDSFVHKYSSL